MGLADDLQQEWDVLVTNPLIERCPVGKIRKHLSDADREAVDTLLENPNATGVKVTGFLNEQGAKMQSRNESPGAPPADDQELMLMQILVGVGEGAVQKHRRGACKCKKGKAQK